MIKTAVAKCGQDESLPERGVPLELLGEGGVITGYPSAKPLLDGETAPDTPESHFWTE